MGKHDSKSASNTTSNRTTFNNVDYRTAPKGGGVVGGDTNLNISGSTIGGGGLGSSTNINIKKTDYGAIQTAGEIANKALDGNVAVSNDAMHAVTTANKNALHTVQVTHKQDNQLTQQLTSQALGIVEKRAASSQQQLVSQFTKLTAVLVAGGVGYAFFIRK